MKHLSAHVMFNGRLCLESTGEDVGKATAAQVARSYCAGNPTVTVSHSLAWFQKHAPRAAAKLAEKK